jgi:hypothetical protein
VRGKQKMKAEECENKVHGCTDDPKPKNHDVSSRYAKHARVPLMMMSWRGGRGIVKDMCYERRRAEACVD